MDSKIESISVSETILNVRIPVDRWTVCPGCKHTFIPDCHADRFPIVIKNLPDEPVTPHPAHKYPKFVQAVAALPNVIKSPADLQTCKSNTIFQTSRIVI